MAQNPKEEGQWTIPTRRFWDQFGSPGQRPHANEVESIGKNIQHMRLHNANLLEPPETPCNHPLGPLMPSLTANHTLPTAEHNTQRMEFGPVPFVETPMPMDILRVGETNIAALAAKH